MDAEAVTVVQQIRAAGEAASAPMLTTGLQTLAFDLTTRLIAYAAKQSSLDGVYRAITDDHTSVFIAFSCAISLERLMFDQDRGINSLAHVASYDAEAFGIEKKFHEQSAALEGEAELALMEELLGEQQAIFDRYWIANDEWSPCSFGWPSDHDPSRIRYHFAVPAVNGGTLVVAIVVGGTHIVYRVVEREGSPRIVDQLIEWGDGFIWPT